MSPSRFLIVLIAIALAGVAITVGATSGPREYLRILIHQKLVVELDLATGSQRFVPATDVDRYPDEDAYQYGEWTITPLKRIDYGGCPDLYNWNPVVKITHADGRHYVVACANSWDYVVQ